MDRKNLDIDLYIKKLRKLGLFIQDLENNTSYPNSLWENMGYTAEQMTNMGFLQFVHPDDRTSIEKSMKHFLTGEQDLTRSLFRMKTSDGEWHWILSTCLAAEVNSEGKISSYVGYDHDITDEISAKEQAEKALREAETLQSAGEIITTQLNLTQTIRAILEQAERVIPYTSATVQLLKGNELEIVGEIGFDLKNPMVGKRFAVTDDIPNYQIINDKKSIIVNSELKSRFGGFKELSDIGILSWMGVPLICKGKVIGMMAFDHIHENQFTEDNQRMARAFANQVAIALENARLYEEAKERAIKDELTGAFTRRHLYSCLEREVEIAKRYNSPLSLIIFDIDDFKLINDRYGHLKGDEVLREIVSLSFGSLRKTDVLFRFGGEEFIALLPSSTPEEAVSAAERIRQVIEENMNGVTVSLGCTSFIQEDFAKSDNFIQRADKALYEAKARGKNRVELL